MGPWGQDRWDRGDRTHGTLGTQLRGHPSSSDHEHHRVGTQGTEGPGGVSPSPRHPAQLLLHNYRGGSVPPPRSISATATRWGGHNPEDTGQDLRRCRICRYRWGQGRGQARLGHMLRAFTLEPTDNLLATGCIEGGGDPPARVTCVTHVVPLCRLSHVPRAQSCHQVSGDRVGTARA